MRFQSPGAQASCNLSFLNLASAADRSNSLLSACLSRCGGSLAMFVALFVAACIAESVFAMAILIRRGPLRETVHVRGRDVDKGGARGRSVENSMRIVPLWGEEAGRKKKVDGAGQRDGGKGLSSSALAPLSCVSTRATTGVRVRACGPLHGCTVQELRSRFRWCEGDVTLSRRGLRTSTEWPFGSILEAGGRREWQDGAGGVWELGARRHRGSQSLAPSKRSRPPTRAPIAPRAGEPVGERCAIELVPFGPPWSHFAHW